MWGKGRLCVWKREREAKGKDREMEREIFPQHKRSTLANKRHLFYLTEPQNNKANIVIVKEENIWLEKHYTVNCKAE